VYVDDYKVISAGTPPSLTECALMSLVYGCEGFLVDDKKKLCVCTIVHDADSSPSINMTLINDMKASLEDLNNPTIYYEGNLTVVVHFEF